MFLIIYVILFSLFLTKHIHTQLQKSIRQNVNSISESSRGDIIILLWESQMKFYFNLNGDLNSHPPVTVPLL